VKIIQNSIAWKAFILIIAKLIAVEFLVAILTQLIPLNTKSLDFIEWISVIIVITILIILSFYTAYDDAKAMKSLKTIKKEFEYSANEDEGQRLVNIQNPQPPRTFRDIALMQLEALQDIKSLLKQQSVNISDIHVKTFPGEVPQDIRHRRPHQSSESVNID
jgi:hypothetical protein